MCAMLSCLQVRRSRKCARGRRERLDGDALRMNELCVESWQRQAHMTQRLFTIGELRGLLLSLNSLTLLLGVVRLFTLLQFHERMAIITNTIETAATELVHFMIIFSMVCGVYAVMGNNLLGSRIDEFTTLTRSFCAMLTLSIDPTADVVTLTLGSGTASDGPRSFNKPTDVAVHPLTNEVFVADGYGNSRVVVFSYNGQYLRQFGRAGTADGAFRVPHSIVVPESSSTVLPVGMP